MLKFAGKWDRFWGHNKLKNHAEGSEAKYGEWRYPTADELDEFNARAYADTIHQILCGQGISWTPEGHADNEIRELYLPPLKERKSVREKKEKQQKPTRYQRKLIRILMANGKSEDEANKLAGFLLGEKETNDMTSIEAKPLHPISDGVIVLVGVKASNFSDDIKNHPRVIMWDSQHEHWLSKDLPTNTRAVFMTRWIGHDAFANIVKQARKRQITVFNPSGTGIITKQVKELLNLNQEVTIKVEEISEMTPKVKVATKAANSKLHVLYPYIDWDKGPSENARVLMPKAVELGVETTLGSISNMVSIQRRKRGLEITPFRPRKQRTKKDLDVTVQMFDEIIKQLTDMRGYLIATTEENTWLRTKVDKFKKFFDE